MSVVSQSTVEENKNVHYLIAEPGCITTIIVKEKAIVEVKVNLVGSAISLELLRILSRENATRPTGEAFKPYLLGVGLNISTLSEEVIGRCLTQPKAVSRNFNSIKNFPLQIGIFSTAKLRLDYVRQGQVKRLVNNSSLIILIIMSAYLAFTYLNLTDKIKLIESATASKHQHKSANTTLLKNSTSLDVTTLQEMKEAKLVIAELGIPWNRIFTEIEALSQENISLLQLQTDINNSTITITGEAKDLTAITNYIKALAESKFFSDVHLLSHQVKSIDIQNSSAFTIKAVWDHKNQKTDR